MKRFIGAGLGMLMAATPVLAQYAPPPPPPGGMGDMRGPGSDWAPKPLTRADFEAMVETHFAAMDANHDGTVTRAEYDAFTAAQRAEMRARMKAHRDHQFAQIDTNKDGMLSRDEFDSPPPPDAPEGAGGPPPPGGPGEPPEQGYGKDFQPHHGMPPRDGPRPVGDDMMMTGPHWFDMADANHDGQVTLAEAKTAAMALFDRMDANHDGVISPEERRAAMDRMMRMRQHEDQGGDMPPPWPPRG